MILWLLVSQDEYELPLIVADSCIELALKVGRSPNSIRTLIRHHSKNMDHRVKCPYIKVEIEE